MIGTAPPPDWAALAAALARPFGPPADDGSLARPWRQGAERAHWFSRGAWAFAALARAFAAARARAPRLWLPGYFCNQSLAALRETGARLSFYPIAPDFEPDHAALRATAAAEPPDLFVLVHSFGRPADGPRARAFCREAGALLIEDAAHALLPAGGIGSHGDFVLYSPNKTLGVPDGGLLLARESSLDLAAAARALGGAAPSPRAWLTRRLARAAIPQGLARAFPGRGPARFDDDPLPAPMPATPGLSALARRMLARAGPRLARLAGRRIEQAAALADLFAGRPGAAPLALPEGAVPYRFVVRLASSSEAAALYARLRSAGLPVETWPDLPPEVAAAPERHMYALALRRTMLLIPVHQPLAPAALARLYAPHLAGGAR
ncbi:MAG: DegT/DnrJ/EryC1/StrS family aminotransferase [Proteobacteria bacterium]|nr:DegT/DnrJ/EryC1/StrS family aminotransferase [Pseudomonadota bacterium]